MRNIHKLAIKTRSWKEEKQIGKQLH